MKITVTRFAAAFGLSALFFAAAPICHADDEPAQRGVAQAVADEEAPARQEAQEAQEDEERGLDQSMGARIGRFLARVRAELAEDDETPDEELERLSRLPLHHPAVVRSGRQDEVRRLKAAQSDGADSGWSCLPSHHPGVVRGQIDQHESCSHPEGATRPGSGGGLDYDPAMRR